MNKMNGWVFIVAGSAFIGVGGILAAYGWHILPKPARLEKPPITITATQETGVPLVDIELARVKASPQFAQFEIQFAYDIVLHNKSTAAISNIHVVRTIIPDKNSQKMAVHESAQQKLKSFQKTINVLGPAESAKIYREHSTSYEFMHLTVTYKDQYDKSFRCTFEGDRDGLRLTNKEILGQTKDRIEPP
jgi:hypothetical protein